MRFVVDQSFAALPYLVCALDGRIVRYGTAPAEMVDMQAHPGEIVLVGRADAALQYLGDPDGTPAVTNRPASPVTIDKTTALANGSDAVTLAGVTIGAAVEITGPVNASGTGDGSDIVLTFEAAGVYRVTVSRWPDLDFEATIHAA